MKSVHREKLESFLNVAGQQFMQKPVDFSDLTEQKISIKDFFRKCDQIHRKLRIWSYLLKKSFI